MNEGTDNKETLESLEDARKMQECGKDGFDTFDKMWESLNKGLEEE